MKYVLGTLAVPLLTILRGFVLKQLWAWFAVPQFHVAPLTIPVALGISLLVGYLTANTSPKHETYSFVEQLVISIIAAILALAFGAIYHAFV
jgi:flagellar biosynthesis protein FliQ